MDKLTVEEAQLIADHRDTIYDEETRALHFVTRKDMAQQLLDTMRENERLREALEDIADMSTNHLVGNSIYEAIEAAASALNPNKHTETEEETLKRKMQKFALPHPSKT